MKLTIAAAVLALLTACSSQPASTAKAPEAANASLYDAQSVPAGDVGDAIKYGRELLLNTRNHLPQYVGANMDCAACHIDAGTKARGGSFAGTAASFPQWNKRAKRVIELQDRLAECFLYSMNGHPPAYNSREMVALAAYITYLSRGVKLGTKPDPAVTLASITLPHPDPKAGGAMYSQKCAMCHGAGGAGSAQIPPLWGSTSFNDGAGMHRLRTMAGFIRYNMPATAPGSLTDRQAFDIAAFVLSHGRPKFQRSKLVEFPAARADYF
ncbi:MAG TPA: c-type cytochrome [Candidatus Baltobacteraceae bacterium]|nr:c-type cytochrome [Candidatus Baltobacteraceae bacterium]